MTLLTEVDLDKNRLFQNVFTSLNVKLYLHFFLNYYLVLVALVLLTIVGYWIYPTLQTLSLTLTLEPIRYILFQLLRGNIQIWSNKYITFMRLNQLKKGIYWVIKNAHYKFQKPIAMKMLNL